MTKNLKEAAKTHTLDISKLAVGVYTIVVTTNQKVNTLKFIKE